MRGKVLDLDEGQNQEAGVVRQQMQMRSGLVIVRDRLLAALARLAELAAEPLTLTV